MIVSMTGPSLTSRPRKAVDAIWKGCTRSSEGPRSEVVSVCITAEILRGGARRVRPKAGQSSAETPGEDALLRMETVFRLVPHHRLRPIENRRADLVAAFRGQAVHEDGVGL